MSWFPPWPPPRSDITTTKDAKPNEAGANQMPFVLYHRGALTKQQKERLNKKYQSKAISDEKTNMSSSDSTSSRPPPSKITHILETCIYCTDLPRSIDFYSNTLGLTPDFSTDRMCVYPLGSTTLLLFQLGKTGEDINMDPEGNKNLVVPKHGPDDTSIPELLQGERKLRQHFCLAVKDKEEAMEWERYFREKDVKVIGRMEWQRGGYSVYLEDPDGHCGEIASRGIWGHY